MKVLFAVSNEEISESIVKKYQREYKQIISYKNVYYFNAILKELQKDKTYDRIVISEDLEAFTNTQYQQIDKFIFEKLDNISDEASNVKGNDTPIILICSDRRTKSEPMLVKLFGIGIYDAIIGNDRSVDEVCRLINKPRTKKEAKAYYKIDTEDVSYQAENENDVSEMEIQNIVAHYKRLGKNEDRYIDSFNNIAAQYNDTQLRIITKFLPLNVRAVLEERSPKYQKIMSFNNTVSDSLRKTEDEENGPSQILLKSKNKGTILSKPVVIPSAVNTNGTKKLAKQKTEEYSPNTSYKKPSTQQPIVQTVREEEEQQPPTVTQQYVKPEPMIEGFEDLDQTQEIAQPVKRGRGRPRKNPVPATETVNQSQPVKRGRGRPRKNPVPTTETVNQSQLEEIILPGLGIEEEVEEQDLEEKFLPGFYDEEDTPKTTTTIPKTQPSQPTFETDFDDIENDGFEDNNITLPGLETEDLEDKEDTIQSQSNIYHSNNYDVKSYDSESYDMKPFNSESYDVESYDSEGYEKIDLSNLLTPDKKIITFVGSGKNGTSFIVNNIAQLMSSIGINVAILDTTKNRNSYYIYTKNEESLREIATHSIEGLSKGIARGIDVNKSLTVYTSLPDEDNTINHVDKILETLLQKHSLILIDTDFDTPLGYFKQSQETYLVQSMDILTIQPLTAFLKELKVKNILDESKLRIVLNKTVKIRGIKDATIIGGMAFYNDPAMSFMTELFDRDRIKYVSIPFEEETYIRYLEGIIECEISLKGYSKMFLQTLKELGNMVYPIVNSTARNNRNYQPPSAQMNSGGNFSSNMNDTLNKMKNF